MRRACAHSRRLPLAHPRYGRSLETVPTAGAFQNKNKGDQINIVRLLLDAGADPDKTDPEGEGPPVMIAVNTNDSEVSSTRRVMPSV